jgi:hypothetical protein
MNARAPLALSLVAGLAAAAPAQETFVVNSTWVEVNAGTITPVANANSILEPGEAARIRIGVEARINGANAIGQTTLFALGPNGAGTVRGLGSVVYDLVGDNNASTANGTWGGFPDGLSGPAIHAPFNVALTPGSPQPGGASVLGLGGAQFLLPGQTANGFNSNVQVFRGVWLPSSHDPRNVQFAPRASVLVPNLQHNSLIVSYGTQWNHPEPSDLLSAKYIPTLFGEGVTIPIIPAPSSVALLGFGLLLAGHRRSPFQVKP